MILLEGAGVTGLKFLKSTGANGHVDSGYLLFTLPQRDQVTWQDS